MDFLKQAYSLQEEIIGWRRDIHMHPELGFQETRTAALVAETLRGMGIEVQSGVGITGVVGRIGSAESGPVIGIRADMDALPIHEANEVEYASQTPGVMHACGHDAHTAILLGVARILSEMPERPGGEIRLLFQPAEEMWDDEGKSGATRMIDDAALKGVDSVIALHVSSLHPRGDVFVGDGHVLAAVDSFEAVIKGEGCHGASPHYGIDPIYITAQVINAIQGIRSRRLNPLAPSVVSIGSIHGGSASNIIPHEVRLVGTIRSYTEEIRSQIHAELERACSVARAMGGDYELEIQRGYPALYNTPEVAALLREVAGGLVGQEKVHVAEPIMGAEDFAYMAQAAPGAMMFLGAKLDELNRPHHSPIFDISEEPLHIGAAVLAETAVRLLKQKAS